MGAIDFSHLLSFYMKFSKMLLCVVFLNKVEYRSILVKVQGHNKQLIIE